jgi:hypothetical protein
VWVTNGVPMTAMNIWVKNIGTVTIPSPWSFQMTGDYLSSNNFWIIQTLSFSNGIFQGVVSQAWQTLYPNGGEVNLGMILASPSGKFIPSSFKINGVGCSIV